jgi:hypothetical protein
MAEYLSAPNDGNTAGAKIVLSPSGPQGDRDPLPTLIPADGVFGRRPALGARCIRPRVPFFG